MDPRGLRKEIIEPIGGFESEFEELVYKGMTKANYRTVLRCQVGEYVLDVVVEGNGGKRVAVLCDGDLTLAPQTRGSSELRLVSKRSSTVPTTFRLEAGASPWRLRPPNG